MLIATPMFSQDAGAPPKKEMSQEEAAKLQEAFEAMFTRTLTIELDDASFDNSMTNTYASEEKEAFVNLMVAPQTFERLAADFEKETAGNERIKMTGKDRFVSNGRQVLMQEGIAENEEKGGNFVTQIFAIENGEESIMVSAIFPESMKDELSPMIRKALSTVVVK